MSESKYCRICLDSGVRMLPISGSKVQDVYEKLTNKKVQEDGPLYYACFICHRQLQNSHQLVVTSQKSDELLKQILFSSELDQSCVSFVTRLTYGLVSSLMGTRLGTLQVPDHNNVIKTENQSESEDDAAIAPCDEAMIKDEPDDDGAPIYEECNVVEKYIFEEDEDHSIESSTKEHISGTHTNIVPHENNSSPIVCDEKSKQVLVVTGKQHFICNDCGKTCDTKALLIKHISGHKAVIKPRNTFSKQNKSYVNKCSESDNLKKGNIRTWEKRFKCQYCDYSCVRNSDLKRHVMTHTGEKPFKCQYCDHTSAYSSHLKVHIRSHTGEKPFKCQYCDYTSACSSHLKVHIRTHTREKPLKRQYCDNKFSQKGKLNSHIRTHTEDKPFKCQYCNYRCRQKTHLNSHIRTHTEEKPFKCQYCDYSSTKNSSLKQHIRIHTGEKPFKCQYCDYRGTQKGLLISHIRTHTGEKPFKCQYCDYTSAHHSALKVHIRTHTGEKPFKCQYCPYAAAHSTYLKTHSTTHTGEKPFKCQYCNYSFAHKINLQRHFRIHTGDAPIKC